MLLPVLLISNGTKFWKGFPIAPTPGSPLTHSTSKTAGGKTAGGKIQDGGGAWKTGEFTTEGPGSSGATEGRLVL